VAARPIGSSQVAERSPSEPSISGYVRFRTNAVIFRI
jgi:hypothetical protein